MKALALALAAVLGTAQLAGCSSNPNRRSTGAVLDDAALTAKVKTALARDEQVAAHNVNVTTYRGLVQLSGFVESEDAARKAADVARSVEGVRDVYNDLRVITPRG
ncbi:MAG TPA: BON domain-containing protein [Burkholderiales bacterium]